MNNSKIVKLGKNQQLFDLNGELTNFELNFQVKSLNNVDFYAIVVDQTTLDNNVNLEFRKTENGMIGGNLYYDKNVYQNYFLCLKSDEDNDVEIIIDKKEVPYVPVENTSQSLLPQSEVKENFSVSKVKSFNWKVISIIVIVVAALAFLWFTRKSKNSKNDDGNILETSSNHNINASPDVNFSSPNSSNSSNSSAVSLSPSLDSNIMKKLNSLSVK